MQDESLNRPSEVSGLVVDADVIGRLVKEVSQGGDDGPEPIESVLDQMLSTHGIVISPHIRTEWEQTCANTWYREWYLQHIRDGSIREVDEPPGDRELKKLLRLQFGLPSSSSDHHLIACARMYPPYYIVSYDHDLYDPKVKSQTTQARRRAREFRQGALCRHLKRTYGITVGMVDHCRDDLVADSDSQDQVGTTG